MTRGIKKNYKSFKTKKRDAIIHEVGGDFDQREIERETSDWNAVMVYSYPCSYTIHRWHSFVRILFEAHVCV